MCGGEGGCLPIDVVCCIILSSLHLDGDSSGVSVIWMRCDEDAETVVTE